MRTAISLAALVVIIFGCRFAYGREHLRKADLHQWYQEDNAKFFDGELPDARTTKVRISEYSVRIRRPMRAQPTS